MRPLDPKYDHLLVPSTSLYYWYLETVGVLSSAIVDISRSEDTLDKGSGIKYTWDNGPVRADRCLSFKREHPGARNCAGDEYDLRLYLVEQSRDAGETRTNAVIRQVTGKIQIYKMDELMSLDARR